MGRNRRKGHHRMHRIRGIAALACTVFLLAACGGQTPNQEASPTPSQKKEYTIETGSYAEEIKKKGKITIGVKFDVPQFGFLNPATNKPEGFDVDLGNIIAEAIGVEVEYVEAISRNRIPFLQEDKVDLIISTMTINEERKQQIDFSNVYYVAKQRLLVKKTSSIKDVKSLDAAKGTVCTAKGSTSEKNIRAAAPNAQVVLQDGYSQCFQLLQNDQAQAVTTDDVILVGLLKNDPDNFKIVGDAFSQEPYGMGIKKGRVGFADLINEILTDVKKDGTWVKLYNKWVKPLTSESVTPPEDEVSASGPSPAASPSATP